MDEIKRLTTQGVEEIFPGGAEALVERLKSAGDRPLRIKLGIDPTRPDLHLGHTVALRKLRQFQDAGHTAILLIGDFTALIGDPTGKSKTRPRLSPEEIEENAKTYLDQAKLILDFETPGRLELRRNSEWLSHLSLQNIIELLASMTVGQMLAKEDFGERYAAKSPIALHEFLYPLMQGYDSVALQADVELGGTDQRFNLLVGRDIQALHKHTPQLCLILPLLVGLDGFQKMSKSLDNYVGLTMDPLTMYSRLEKVRDDLVERYFSLLTDFQISILPTHARERQKLLALTITTQYHGREAAEKAQADAITLTSTSGTGDVSDQIPSFSFGHLSFPLRLAELLKEAGLCPSNSQARTQISGGGVRLEGEKITDPEYQIPDPEMIEGKILQLGKKQFRRLICEKSTSP
jgi:tyrosyl-tRNA synthetase